MTRDRIEELFFNMLDHITEPISGDDLYDTLSEIGFTYKEMVLFDIELNEKDSTEHDICKCPECKHAIFMDECESDKRWDDDGNHILELHCPHCGNWFDY